MIRFGFYGKVVLTLVVLFVAVWAIELAVRSLEAVR